ncbi:hypothetical protein WJX72_004052 [[Myrmecia] bisecta]|uniref:Protein kinase domain-containing protein n=1 Tax=[Myrmecia] bisecta TaxID=41462 RepID=A0AAW1PTJ7_9CHLO
MGGKSSERGSEIPQNAVQSFLRTAEFWSRASGIYLAYKGCQLRSQLLTAKGWDKQRLEEELWTPHHDWAGREMYSLAVDLRGFYLKVGQFIGARRDFIPPPMCEHLSKLHDQVPPMSAEETRRVIEREFGGRPLEEVFEWIDLDHPLGSASISQVHKAKLRSTPWQGPANGTAHQPTFSSTRPPPRPRASAFGPLDTYRGPCSSSVRFHTALQSLDAPASIPPSQLPLTSCCSSPRGAWHWPARDSQQARPSEYASEVARAAGAAMQSREAPKNGIVAVKVQYPGALPAMMGDLSNVRKAAKFLQATELKFDMVSAVAELAKQIRLEFDFEREARVMDTIAEHLKDIRHKVQVPRSIPGLVTRQVLVMEFLDGVQITRLGDRVDSLSPAQQRLAKRRILGRVSEAYGRMLLLEGLFQADGHPGNILVMKGGKIGLLDYGQSKQLPEHSRLVFARLILALAREDEAGIVRAIGDLGIVLEKGEDATKAKMSYGMFDTRGKVDPFDEDSPLKKMGITTFPSDMFFVLRVVQLLRGMSFGMDIGEFSSAKQWEPFAEQALRGSHHRTSRRAVHF